MHELLVAALVCLASAALTHVAARSRVLEGIRGPAQKLLEQRWIDRAAGDNQNMQDAFWASEEWCSRGAYFLGCTWCTGFWVGGAVTLGADLVHGAPLPLLLWGAAMWTAGRYGG